MCWWVHCSWLVQQIAYELLYATYIQSVGGTEVGVTNAVSNGVGGPAHCYTEKKDRVCTPTNKTLSDQAFPHQAYNGMFVRVGGNVDGVHDDGAYMFATDYNDAVFVAYCYPEERPFHCTAFGFHFHPKESLMKAIRN